MTCTNPVNGSEINKQRGRIVPKRSILHNTIKKKLMFTISEASQQGRICLIGKSYTHGMVGLFAMKTVGCDFSVLHLSQRKKTLCI